MQVSIAQAQFALGTFRLAFNCFDVAELPHAEACLHCVIAAPLANCLINYLWHSNNTPRGVPTASSYWHHNLCLKPDNEGNLCIFPMPRSIVECLEMLRPRWITTPSRLFKRTFIRQLALPCQLHLECLVCSPDWLSLLPASTQVDLDQQLSNAFSLLRSEVKLIPHHYRVKGNKSPCGGLGLSARLSEPNKVVEYLGNQASGSTLTTNGASSRDSLGQTSCDVNPGDHDDYEDVMHILKRLDRNMKQICETAMQIAEASPSSVIALANAIPKLPAKIYNLENATQVAQSSNITASIRDAASAVETARGFFEGFAKATCVAKISSPSSDVEMRDCTQNASVFNQAFFGENSANINLELITENATQVAHSNMLPLWQFFSGSNATTAANNLLTYPATHVAEVGPLKRAAQRHISRYESALLTRRERLCAGLSMPSVISGQATQVAQPENKVARIVSLFAL